MFAQSYSASGYDYIDRGTLTNLLSRFDSTGQLRFSLPGLSSALEIEGRHLHTSSGGGGNGEAPQPESLRRRGGHPPCECPEEWDTASDDCINRRYNLVIGAVVGVMPIQSNSTELRRQYFNLESKVEDVVNRTGLTHQALLLGSGRTSSLSDQTDLQIRIMKRVAEALTSCVSSIWIQQFGLTSKLEHEMDRLDGMVANATEQLVGWFSRLQQREETLTYQNQLNLAEKAVGAMNRDVKEINYYNYKNFDALAKLDSGLGGSSAGTDALARALNSAADLVSSHLDSYKDKVTSIATEERARIESEIQERVGLTLSKYSNLLIGALNSVTSRKLAQLRDQSQIQFQNQANSMRRDFIPQVQAETLAAMTPVVKSADEYSNAVTDLKAHFDMVVDSVLQNQTLRIRNMTASGRSLLTDIYGMLQRSKTDLQEFNERRAQLRVQLSQKLANLNTKIQSGLTNMITSLGDGKMRDTLASVSSIVADDLSKLDALQMNNVYKLKRSLADHSGDDATRAHQSESESQRVTGGIRQKYLKADAAISSAIEGVNRDQAAILPGIINRIEQEIAYRVRGMPAVDLDRTRQVTSEFRANALSNVQLYSSKVAEDGDVSSTIVSQGIINFLKYLSLSATSAQYKQSQVRKLTNQGTAAGDVQSKAPFFMDSFLRNNVAKTAEGIANGEEQSRQVLQSLEQQIPIQMNNQLSRDNRYIRDMLQDPLDQLGHIQSQLDNAVNLNSRSVGSGIDSITDAKSKVGLASESFDSISTDRLNGVDSAVSSASAPIYQIAARESNAASRMAYVQMHKLSQFGFHSGSMVDGVGLDFLEQRKSELERHKRLASMLQRFVDGTSPMLAKAAAELVNERFKAASVFGNARRDLWRYRTDQRENMTEIWEERLRDIKDRLLLHNSTSIDELNSVSAEALAQMEDVPERVRASVEKFVDAFMNQENLLEIQLRNVSKSAMNKTALARQNLTTSQLNTTANTSVIYGQLRNLTQLSTRVLASNRLLAQAPFPLPFQLVSRVLRSRANATQVAKAVTDTTIDQINARLNNAMSQVNNTMRNATTSTFRAGIESQMNSQFASQKVSSIDSFLKTIYGDTDDVVDDYRSLVGAQVNKSAITADGLFDKLTQVKSGASDMLGLIAQHIAQSRESSAAANIETPKITTGLIRQQVAAIGKLFDIYNKGSGLQGILKSGQNNLIDAGATLLHMVQVKNADLDNELDSVNRTLSRNVNEINDGVTNFRAEIDDVNNTVVDLRVGIGMWANTTFQDLKSLDNRTRTFNLSQPDIRNPILSALTNLVQIIETALSRSLSANKSSALNKSLNSYVSKLNLTLSTYSSNSTNRTLR